MARHNNIEDSIDIEYAIREIDRTIDKLNREAGEQLFGRDNSEDIGLYNDMIKAINSLINLVEYEAKKIDELEKRLDRIPPIKEDKD